MGAIINTDVDNILKLERWCSVMLLSRLQEGWAWIRLIYLGLGHLLQMTVTLEGVLAVHSEFSS